MGNFLDSLSIGSGALLVAVISVGLVWLLCSVSAGFLHKVWAALAPFVVAYCVYWVPVWLGAAVRSEYSVWAFVIVPWFLAGMIPSVGLVLYLQPAGRSATKEQWQQSLLD